MGKIKLNKDGLKGLFVNHVEKMVLAGVLMLAGLFVYTGYGLEGLKSDQTPSALKTSAEAAKATVTEPKNWEGINATIERPTKNYSQVAKEIDGNPIPVAAYPISKPYYNPGGPDGTRREDPKLFAPEKLEVTPIYGAIAYQMKKASEDTFNKLPNSAPPVKLEKKQPSQKKSGRGKGGEGEVGPGGLSGSGGEGSGDAGGGGILGGAAGMPGIGSGMPGMPGMPGGDAGTPGVAIQASPADRPGFAGGQGAVGRSASCIAVKALVPWKKQWEEFDARFSTSLGFNPVRDTPRYIAFTAERLEVTDPAAPLDWSKAVKITSRTSFDATWKSGFYNFPAEIADSRYLFPNVLTFNVPPFMNRELDQLALHSEVPRMTLTPTVPSGNENGDTEKNKKKKGEEKKKSDESDDPGDIAGDGMAPGSGVLGSGMPGSGDAGGGPGMPGGMGGLSGPGGYPGMGGGAGEGRGGGMGGGMIGMGGGMAGMGMGMPGMGDGGGGGMPGMGDPSAIRGPTVPHLLVRFFDFNVEAGKKYRYRIQMVIEDPNHPQFPGNDPNERYLDDAVKKRLAKVQEDEKAKDKTKPTRIYFVRSDFSEPSEIVGVSISPRSLAGQVSSIKSSDHPEKTFEVTYEKKKVALTQIPSEEPTAKVMSVVWDPNYATEVPRIVEAHRGSYLDGESNADAIHPVSLVYKLIEKFNFQTQRFVADIRGGENVEPEKLLTPDIHPMVALGEYAIIDELGQIQVRNELTDWDDYRKLALPEIPDAMAGMSGMGGDAGEGGVPGMPGGPGGYPGMPGGGGKGAKGKGRAGS